MVGGFPAATDNVESAIFQSNGGTTRASMLALSAVYGAFLFLPYLYQLAVIVPYPMLGGMYFYLGLDQLWENLGPRAFSSLRRSEYWMCWGMLILYVSTAQNLMVTVGVGVGWSILIFLKTISRTQIITFDGVASACPSFTSRAHSEQADLRSFMSSTHVVRLGGNISFAQVKNVSDQIEQIALKMVEKHRIRRLLLDFGEKLSNICLCSD
jgi:MFS superfamily sulfate permease-like transporter